MVNRTLHYYDGAAADLADRYEGADVVVLQRDMLVAFDGIDLVLELGCGSGREAAALAARGTTVVALDGSSAMILQCAARHPELAGAILRLPLPAPLPFRDGTFGGVCAVALLMHLDVDEIGKLLAEASRVLAPSGVLFLSVPSNRDDVGTDGHDRHGRRFTGLAELAWRDLLAAAGFQVTFRRESADGLDRASVRWYSFAAVKTAAPDGPYGISVKK